MKFRFVQSNKFASILFCHNYYMYWYNLWTPPLVIHKMQSTFLALAKNKKKKSKWQFKIKTILINLMWINKTKVFFIEWVSWFERLNIWLAFESLSLVLFATHSTSHIEIFFLHVVVIIPSPLTMIKSKVKWNFLESIPQPIIPKEWIHHNVKIKLLNY